MRDELYGYYDEELRFLRRMGVEFAKSYPRFASQLQLERDKCEDPHVERILEAFAFLTARIHLKIDDEFPEITEAFLSIVYPHYVRPVPSMSIVEMVIDPERGKLSSGLRIARGTPMYSKKVGGDPCRFQTCYDTTLWPVTITEAAYGPPDRLNPAIKSTEAVGALRLRLKAGKDVIFQDLKMDTLRFYLHDESARIVHTLYELLLNNVVQVVVRDPANTRRPGTILPASAIRPMGFSEEESMLPYPRRSFLAYRLLQEYFAFPDKFFFLELSGLSQAFTSGYKEDAEIIFLIKPFEMKERHEDLLSISPSAFRLSCVPIINLFPQTCEPILLNQRKYEYPVVPDVRRVGSTEIYSIEQVVSIDPQSRETQSFEPFYSYRHAAVRDNKQTFWLANRRKSMQRDDEGVDLTISLVDLSMRQVEPDVETLTIKSLCTNRDLPVRLKFGDDAGDFTIEGMAALKKIVCVRNPTRPLRSPVGKAGFWRLISHFSLNYLSLVEEGKDALQEILRLYNFREEPHVAKQIEGLVSLKSSRQFARVISENGISFSRGTRVELEFDEDHFQGGGVYLFASVLEYFLGLYATLNSFSQLSLRTRQRKEVVREWLPRAGQRILM